MTRRSTRFSLVLLLVVAPALAGLALAVPWQGDRAHASSAASLVVEPTNRAILWDGGQTIDLGTLGGAGGRAQAINAAGQVVGWAEVVMAIAQPATPPPGSEVPPPEACQVSPLTAEELIAVIATPATPAATGTPSDGLPASGSDRTVASETAFPTGEPVDSATADAVAAVVREVVACHNAGDDFRFLALLSDVALRVAFTGSEVTAEEVATAAAATPVPLPEGERVAILALRDARRFADGRVGVVLVSETLGDDEGPTTSLQILVNAGARWLIDATIVVDPAAP